MATPRSNNHVALRDVAFEKIRDMIVSGTLAPGERLIEESLGQQLGMSRNPVRESLKLLEREQFVTIHPYRGAVVSRLGRAEALDVFEIREVLDSFAAGKAATNAKPRDVTRLREILSQGTQMIERGQMSKLGLLNSRFHAAVYAMANNVELRRMLEQLRLKVEWIFAGYSARRGAASWHEHQQLLEAIDAGDADLAGIRSREHVAASKIAYLELLDSQPQPDPNAEAGAGDQAKARRRPATSSPT
jgi:DNA-binding GntR family transcriptional regulator